MISETVQPRTGAKRTVLHAIRHIPSYIRLLFGLMRDGRVSRMDRLMVLGAIAYMISPLDFIPDFIPFFGEVDDVFFVMLAVQRLMDGAGKRVLLDHWRGSIDDLSELSVARIVGAAGFFLPIKLRRRLRRMARRAESEGE